MLFPAVRHELSFWHGADRLCGDLRVPACAGPHPVVVVVPEPGERISGYSPWLDALAHAGIASFGWDRPESRDALDRPARRVGRQAREVLASVERLRGLPHVDAAAVALLGWGEGGWAAAQATTFSDHIAALVLACTPVEPAADGRGHDLRPTLSAVTAPVLALFGEQDPVADAGAGVRGVRTALRDAGHADHEVAVVRGADHGLRVRAPHGLGDLIDGRYRFGDWPDGLTHVIVTWLEGRLRQQEVPTFAPPLHAPAVRLPVRSRAMLPAPVPVRQLRRRVARRPSL